MRIHVLYIWVRLFNSCANNIHEILHKKGDTIFIFAKYIQVLMCKFNKIDHISDKYFACIVFWRIFSLLHAYANFYESGLYTNLNGKKYVVED